MMFDFARRMRVPTMPLERAREFVVSERERESNPNSDRSETIMPMQRKLVKVAKKLKKLWPGKKRKKLPPPSPPVLWINDPPQPQLEYYHLPPPPYDFYFPCPSSSFQPSAPPLPPWLEPEPEPDPDLTETDESILLLCNTTSSISYSTIPTPDYGVPVSQHPNGKRLRSGFFRFVVNVFVRFCPCLRITEVR